MLFTSFYFVPSSISREYLTGFHKRKLERRKAAVKEIEKKIKEEQKRVREEVRFKIENLTSIDLNSCFA